MGWDWLARFNPSSACSFLAVAVKMRKRSREQDKKGNHPDETETQLLQRVPQGAGKMPDEHEEQRRETSEAHARLRTKLKRGGQAGAVPRDVVQDDEDTEEHPAHPERLAMSAG
eukprot:gene4480-17281_t